MDKNNWLKLKKTEFLMLTASDPYKWAADKAYLTFCRVLSGYSAWEQKWELEKNTPPPYKLAHECLIKNLHTICETEKFEADTFDAWHKKTAFELVEKYAGYNQSGNVPFTVGCAQKWINVALKYLYVLNDIYFWWEKTPNPEVFRFCHIPIDSYVVKNAACIFGISPEWETAWSKLDDYDKYMSFQRQLMSRAKSLDICLLDLDFVLWARTEDECKDKISNSPFKDIII